MTKKFKAKNIIKLDNPLRRKVLPPKAIIKIIELKEGNQVADVGCGIGYFTVPMAKHVGDKGKIYAIDINPKMLEETRKRCEDQNLSNIDIVHSSENNFKIPDGSVDIVFTSTVFHELESPQVFLQECKRVLVDQGVMIVLDWNKIEEEIGPPIHIRKEVEEVKARLKENNFTVNKIDYIDKSFYIIEAH